MLVLSLALLGCTPEDLDKCASGVRESFTADVSTPDGTVGVTTTQCVTSAWTETACDDGPELCRWFFEPHTPAEVPLELIFGDFVFRHAVGHVEVAPPSVLTGTDLRAGLEQVQSDRVAAGYLATSVATYTLIDGAPAYELTSSCEHPSLDPICPFTWSWLLVDLSAQRPGLYAEFSAQTAEFYNMGSSATELPVAFDQWDEMVASVTVEIAP